jgi:Flp pilus assembly protein TadG
MNFSGAKKRAARFKRDAKGVAAVEFALVFPIMIALYLGSVEISGALQANKNVSKIASTVADLVTQQENVTKSEIKAIAEIGEAIMFPYTETAPEITLVGIRVEDKPNPRAIVAWSRRYMGGATSQPIAPGTEIEIPARLKIQDSFLVRGTADLSYKPVVTWSSKGEGVFSMDETYYLRPRLSAEVTCDDC